MYGVLFVQLAGMNPGEWTAVYFGASSMPVDDVMSVVIRDPSYVSSGFYIQNVCGYMCFPFGRSTEYLRNNLFIRIKVEISLYTCTCTCTETL